MRRNKHSKSARRIPSLAQRKRMLCAFVFLIFAAGPLLACNIPVFRYALERWQSDNTQIIVVHDSPLAEQEQALIDQWTSRCVEGQGTANATVALQDLARPDSKYADLLASLEESTQGKLSLPHVVLRSAIGKGREVNFWHGTLSDSQALQPFASPVRAELQRRLLEGHSVVWLIVKSSDASQNDNARRVLESQFGPLANTMALPEGIGLPGSELYADVPLVLRFSLLELDPQDPAEGYLTSLFTGIRKAEFEAGQPLIVPIFGRGRALEVIPASDLSEGLVRDLTHFLSGACSCQVKEQNPGFDLLLEASWDDELFGGTENRPPDRSQEEGKNRAPVLVPIAPGR